MRTLFLILLCIIILAPGASARKQKDDSSDSTATVQSSSDTSDRSHRSDNSSSSSSDSSSSHRSSETKSSSESSYHPSEPARPTPREDPPPVVIRVEPKPEPPAPKPEPPKPAEETNRKSDSNSYRPIPPEPDPVKYIPPAPPPSSNASSENESSRPLSRKEIRQRDKAEEASVQPIPSAHRQNSSTNNTTHSNKDTTTSAPATHDSYRPGKPSHSVVAPPSTTVTTTTPPPTEVHTDQNPPSAYNPKPSGNSGDHGFNVIGPTTQVGSIINSAQGSHGNAPAPKYSPRKQAKLDQRAKDAQDKATREALKPAYRPDVPTGAKPSGQTTKNNHPTDNIDRRPGQVNGLPGYRPGEIASGTTHNAQDRPFNVGYHPQKYQRPQGYRPPIIKDGRWQYSTPPFVENRRPRYHPVARFHRPCNYGHWAYDYYPGFSWRSFYYYFDVYPYVEVTSIQECPPETIEFVSEPIYVTGGTYVRDSKWDRVDEALADIRSAWISGRFDLLKQHVKPNTTMAVLTDGDYDYAISSEDYLSMTEDALSDLQTASFVWNKVRERKDGTIMSFADHSYWATDRAKTVYVSYTLKRIGRDYFITEIGSSANPLN